MKFLNEESKQAINEKSGDQELKSEKDSVEFVNDLEEEEGEHEIQPLLHFFNKNRKIQKPNRQNDP